MYSQAGCDLKGESGAGRGECAWLDRIASHRIVPATPSPPILPSHRSFDVENDLVGGTSTVYIQRVVKSGYFEGMKEKMAAERPSDEALEAMKVVRELEDPEEGSSSAFIFKTMFENNCKTLSVPPRIWRDEK